MLESRSLRGGALLTVASIAVVLAAGGVLAGSKGGKAKAKDDPGDDLVSRLSVAVGNHAAGYEASGQATIAHLEKKGSKVVEVDLEQGWCYRLFATGSKDSFKLTMQASIGSVVVAARSKPSSLAVADACAPKQGKLSVEVATDSFGGDFILAAYRIKSSKTPGKDELGSRIAVIAEKNVPGAKSVTGAAYAVLGGGQSLEIAFGAKLGTCYRALGVGGAGVEDLDVELEMGSEVVAQDGTTGDHPLAGWCAEAKGDAVAKATVVSGKGLVAAVVLEAAGETVKIGQTDPQAALDSRLGQEAAVWASGMSMIGTIKNGTIANKKPLNVDLGLAAGVCYRFIAVGGAGISNLDLTLQKAKVKGKKGLLAADTTKDDAPVASYCADASGEAVLSLTAQGSGLYSLGIYAGAAPGAGIAGGFEELSDLLETAGSKLPKGWKAADTMKTAVLVKDAAASFDVKLQDGSCYGLLAVGMGTVKSLSIEVVAEGLKLAAEASQASEIFVEVCPDDDTVAAVKILSPSGYGPIAFRPYSKASDVDNVFIPIGGLVKGFLSKSIRELHDKHGKSRPAVWDYTQGTLETAGVKTYDIELEGGLCYTALAVGNPSVKEIELTLTSPLGEEVAHAGGQGAKVVMHTDPCPKWSGTYKLSVKMFSGYGGYGVQVFGADN